ncbi:glycosyltransferase family A protein [Aureimonas sp. AU20]|uniref:glycosyltransferase family A protein n=1 Tax=Aureimonas sp. AU20 TaxID=1349819 RepID=UPI0007202773|nr:glycosyltransferase family A protein [Aureimonas sp. AU20]ALN74688.1 hypothetical protein M673_18375 [Aureimonas sp. AU20]
MSYCALIRTFNSAGTLPETLASLSRQSVPPLRHVFVDSGSSDGTPALFPPGSVSHRYIGAAFNYSEALNQGIGFVDTPYVLVVSSHTSLANEQAIGFALDLLARDDRLGAAYFLLGPPGPFSYERVDGESFHGFNGVWNTCALYRTALLKRRGFRPEVFSAEDQEWSRWLFETEGLGIARISGGGMIYDSPLRYPLSKWLREYLAVAMYAKPSLLGWRAIARVAGRVVKPRTTVRARWFNAVLFAYFVLHRLRGSRRRA